MNIENLNQLKIFLANPIIKKIDFNKSPKFKQNKDLLNNIRAILEISYSELKYITKNINSLENIHIFCPVCGNKNKFNGYKKGYNNHCSIICAANDPRRIIKTKQTCLEKYGDKNYRNIDKIKSTKLQKYGDENYINLKKRKQTCLKKYGAEHHLKLQKYKQQKSDLWKNKKWAHNNIYNNQLSKLEKYGIKGYNNRNKSKQTCLEKYGVEHHTMSKQYKNLFNNKEWVNNIQKKRYNTMKLNDSFNVSKPEDECYNLLLNKFDKEDIIRQYKSDLYPFNCDFYIKSLDLYIECNFHWTHCNVQFNRDNEKHIVELEKLKSKSDGKNQYCNAINVWTIKDPLKLETFKKNNLNYKIFYNIKEFIEWFEIL